MTEMNRSMIDPKQSTVAVSLDTEQQKARITITGNFDIELGKVFLSRLSELKQNYRIYEVDLGQCNNLSPAALCSLILLKEHVDKHQGRIILTNATQEFEELIDIVIGANTDTENKHSSTIAYQTLH